MHAAARYPISASKIVREVSSNISYQIFSRIWTLPDTRNTEIRITSGLIEALLRYATIVQLAEERGHSCMMVSWYRYFWIWSCLPSLKRATAFQMLSGTKFQPNWLDNQACKLEASVGWKTLPIYFLSNRPNGCKADSRGSSTTLIG